MPDAPAPGDGITAEHGEEGVLDTEPLSDDMDDLPAAWPSYAAAGQLLLPPPPLPLPPPDCRWGKRGAPLLALLLIVAERAMPGAALATPVSGGRMDALYDAPRMSSGDARR